MSPDELKELFRREFAKDFERVAVIADTKSALHECLTGEEKTYAPDFTELELRVLAHMEGVHVVVADKDGVRHIGEKKTVELGEPILFFLT
ncbi:hypothetical protein G3V96_26445, partial [Escherichia coli]|nr:hypothetical protein [Escherichia coli]